MSIFVARRRMKNEIKLPIYNYDGEQVGTFSSNTGKHTTFVKKMSSLDMLHSGFNHVAKSARNGAELFSLKNISKHLGLE